MLELQKISVQLHDKYLIQDITAQVEEGDWLMIIGPNGAGKTSLIRALSGVYPYTGQIIYQGQDLKKLSAKAKARRMGFLLQQQNINYDFTVEEIVRLGRYAYSDSWFQHLSDQDRKAIDQAIEWTGLTGYTQQSIRSLSGGEVQRVFLAQILAQDPDILILDEPTNHLDIIYEQEIFTTVKNWLQQEGKAVISIVHDLSLAKQYSSHALILNHGQQIAFGPSDTVLKSSILNPIYGIDIQDYMETKYLSWQNLKT